MAEEPIVVNIEKDKWTRFEIVCDNKPITRYLNVDGKNQALFLVCPADTRLLKNIEQVEDSTLEDHKNLFAQMYIDDMDDELDFTAYVSFFDDTVAEKFTRRQTTSRHFFRDTTVIVQIRFFNKLDSSEYENSLVEQLMKFLESKSPDVTLVGRDGEQMVKRDLLIARSTVFKAMFDPEKNSRELQILRIELPDSSQAALQELVLFFEKDMFNPCSKNVLELLILADKYDLPNLKKKSQVAAIETMNDVNARETCQVFSKVCPDVLENIFKSHCKKIKSSPFLELEMEGQLFEKQE